jgi:hypothetical protein
MPDADRNAAAKARQLWASWPSPGNLAVRKTAWWTCEDSNCVPGAQSCRNRFPPSRRTAPFVGFELRAGYGTVRDHDGCQSKMQALSF